MGATVLIDSGPIVAALSKRDARHAWAVGHFQSRESFDTCEAVISEAFFLLRHCLRAKESLCRILEAGVFRLRPMDRHMPSVAQLMRRYADRPMSFADACLVRLAELDECAVVFTTDNDFRIYRKNNRQIIPLVI